MKRSSGSTRSACCPGLPSTTTSRSRTHRRCPRSWSPRLAARDLKVVLTGDGGDETFGGYERYRWYGAMSIVSGLGGRAHLPAVDVARAFLRATAPRHRLRRRADSWRRYAALDRARRYTGLMTQIHADVARRTAR